MITLSFWGYGKIAKDYRDKCVFHVQNRLSQYWKAREDFNQKRQAVMEAMQKFAKLAAMLRTEQSTIPDFESRLDKTLKKTIPERGQEELDRLKRVFLYPAKSSK